MMVERAWLDDGDTIINEWFVEYWITYREIIESLYPKINSEIRTMTLNRMNKK